MKSAARRGFTIVELLVVITIIGILMAMLFPAINSAPVAARRIQCVNNLGQVGGGVLQAATQKDQFPGWKWNYVTPGAGGSDVLALNWVTKILPFIDRQDLYDKITTDNTAQGFRMELLLCPANLPPGRADVTTGYFPNAGISDDEVKWAGVFFDHTQPRSRRISLSMSDLRDGGSNTIIASENTHWARKSNDAGAVFSWNSLIKQQVTLTWQQTQDSSALDSAPPWTPIVSAGTGTIEDVEHRQPSSRHPGDFVVVYGDKHTQVVNDQISYRVYHYLMTSAGGSVEAVDYPYEKEQKRPLQNFMLQP